jgi:hypothetical protein
MNMAVVDLRVIRLGCFDGDESGHAIDMYGRGNISGRTGHLPGRTDTRNTQVNRHDAETLLVDV